MRIFEAPEPAYDRSHHYHEASPFTATWVAHPDAADSPDFDGVFVAPYRLTVTLTAPERVRVHVSADERYAFAVDGAAMGRGPERGDRDHWHFETYDLDLAAGPHELVATVHSMGKHRPYAQVSVRHGLLVMAEGEASARFSTGVAPWVAEHIDAYAPLPAKLPHGFIATGAHVRIDGTALRATRAVEPVKRIGPMVLSSMRMEAPAAWQLMPSPLLPMLKRPVSPGLVRQVEGPAAADAWQQFLDGRGPLVVPPHATARAIVDLKDYYCAYATLTAGGAGATVRMEWAEALFDAEGRAKSDRSAVDGLHFFGFGDAFACADHALAFVPLWWSAGRYVRLTVETADAACTLQSLALSETRYPATWDSGVRVDDGPINAFVPLARRAIEMCSHETYYDCPYYEQLMYVGDTRLEALVSYAYSCDDRLPRKAVRLFDESRQSDGWTQARYPSKIRQTIPPFSWWWVAMVHDLMMWRDHPAEVAEHLRGVRAVMEAGYAAVNADGLYQPTTGWNFVDCGAGWPGGVPIGGADRPVAPIHFQLAYAARLAAELEQHAGEPLLAERHRNKANGLIAAGRAAFFDAGRSLFADDVQHGHFSEHAQAMAILSGALPDAAERQAVGDRLIDGAGLTRATIYYTHYVLEAFRVLRRADAFFDRLSFWSDLAARGFKTTPEQPEPSRSDCHGWGAHPLFHLIATVIGLRPTTPGFGQVVIEPQLGRLTEMSARIVHPRGFIDVHLTRDGERYDASVQLPEGVTGTLILNGERRVI